MVGVYVLLAISIVVGIISCVLAILAMRNQKGGSEQTTAQNDVELKAVQDAIKNAKGEINMNVEMSKTMLMGTIGALDASVKHLSHRIDNLAVAVDNKIEQLRTDTYNSLSGIKDSMLTGLSEVNKTTSQSINELKTSNALSLKEVRDDNARNLEKMRETVDEKLSSTLEARFNQSFKIVNDRLEEINRTFGELQGLQSGISDLNKIFKNVKARGTWGEVSLENLLTQILTPEQFDKQVRIKRGSEDMVDFVIRMPGKGDGEVLLPLDAKFPVEDYARLAEASEKGDVDGIEVASKALAKRVKDEAMSIRDKYVNPPKTTDFAVMYLPTEGLYAEIIRREGLVEEIQNKYRVVVCGPTTLAALLNSLQMGFRSVAVEKRSAEIGKLMRSFIADFDKFADLLAKTGTKLGSVQDTLQNAEKRTEIIRNKLDKVGKLTVDEEVNLVESTSEAVLYEIE